ncbi:MAG: O-antigen ligase family protein [Chloroflexi bacterium]|nr:O-antigen ligase family protein [Chloroflexota bacterium]
MRKNPPARVLPAPDGPAREELSIRERILAILGSDPLVNGVVAVAITVGFFHGWLKIRFPHPATTFLFDALLCVALALAFSKQKRGGTLIPPGPIGSALKAFYLLCFVYLLLPLPDRPPFVISVAAIRGWCFATLMFCLGYWLTKSITQVKGYFYVLILLGLVTAGYGLRQTPAEIEKQAEEDENFAERYKYTFYHTEKGRQLRIFSTFVSSGAFGGTMAYVTIFAIALISDPQARRKERLLLLAAVIPIAYALVRSGARSALASLACGFLIIAWQRRNFQIFVLIPACIIFAIKLGIVVSGGALTERYGALLHFDEIYHRQSIPISIGWDYMLDDHWLGSGLGKSGYSVPSFLSNKVGFTNAVFADGDLGRLMIELGVPGLIFFGRIIWVAFKTLYRRLDRLRNTPVSTVALASSACVFMAIISLPSGSPFLGIPMGAMVWFFLGTFNKLADEYERGSFVQPAETAVANAPPKRFLYYRPPAQTVPSFQARKTP